jgi:hypothetical protein
VHHLLLKALHHASNSISALQTLCGLAGASELPAPQAVMLLSAALRCAHASESLPLLLTLPAMQHIETDGLQVIVRQAMMVGRLPVVEDLLKLPAAKQFPAATLVIDMAAMLHLQRDHAAMLEADGTFRMFCQLLGDAEQLTPIDFSLVLMEITRLPGMLLPNSRCSGIALDWLQHVLLLPQAQELALSSVHELLLCALQQQPLAVPVLCRLPQVQQLSPEAVHALLFLAVTAQPQNTPPYSPNNITTRQMRQALSCICKLLVRSSLPLSAWHCTCVMRCSAASLSCCSAWGRLMGLGLAWSVVCCWCC